MNLSLGIGYAESCFSDVVILVKTETGRAEKRLLLFALPAYWVFIKALFQGARRDNCQISGAVCR
jgi:hypothetical protein